MKIISLKCSKITNLRRVKRFIGRVKSVDKGEPVRRLLRGK
jgi:hypothetical protein